LSYYCEKSSKAQFEANTRKEISLRQEKEKKMSQFFFSREEQFKSSSGLLAGKMFERTNQRLGAVLKKTRKNKARRHADWA